MSCNVHIIKTAPPPSGNKYFENVAKLKYLGMMATKFAFLQILRVD
jgi:hypothetical protein